MRSNTHRWRTWTAVSTAVVVAAAGVVLAVGTGTAAAADPAPAKAPPLSCTGPKGTTTVVMVHGAWADTSSWSGEVSSLLAAGCPAVAYANPLRGLTGDAVAVANYVRTIPGPVLLVGHSYGGSVITNAAALAPNVTGLVYVDAAAPAKGETTGGLSGANSALNTRPADQVFSYADYPGGPKDVLLQPAFFQSYFAQDIPTPRSTQIWATQRATSSAAFDTPSKYEAWKTLPSWAFISTGDKIIVPQSLIRMAVRAGANVTVFNGGSHLTLISHPSAVTAVIAKALAAVR